MEKFLTLTQLQWTGISALVSAAVGVFTLASAIAIWVQIRQYRIAQIDATIERARLDIMPTRKKLFDLQRRRLMNEPWDEKTVSEFRDVVMRYEAFTPIITLSAKRYRRLAVAGVVQDSVLELSKLMSLMDHFMEQVKQRESESNKNWLIVINSQADEMGIESEDREELIRLYNDGTGEEFTNFLEILTLKQATKKGLSGKALQQLKSQRLEREGGEYSSDDLLSRRGASVETKRILDYWLDEADYLVSRIDKMLTEMGKLAKRYPEIDALLPGHGGVRP